MNKTILSQAFALTLILVLVAHPSRADELADLRARAATGGSEARIELADKLIKDQWDGDGVAKLNEARDILVKEAATGIAEAQYLLGRLLISGLIASGEASARASAKVKPAYDKFRADRTEENMRAYGAAYRAALFEQEDKLVRQKEKELTEGLSWLRLAMAQGHENAALELAETLSDKNSNPAQKQEGVLLYRKLAEQGNPTALLEVAGEHLAAGQAPEAEKIYRALATKGNKKAMHNLANLLLAPDRKEADQREGISLLRKFAESGHSTDQEKLLNHLLREGASAAEEEEGLELLADYTMNKELEFARKLFMQRLEKGQTLPKSLADIGDIYQAAKAGDVASGNMIGEAFLNGIPPFPQDQGAADGILDPLATKSKDIGAMLLLGDSYSRDFSVGLYVYSERFFRMAAEAGQEELAELYLQACLLKDPAAMRLIALLKSTNNPLLGVSPAAFYWAGEGARQGDARAQQLLANFYFNQKNNLIEGLAWLKAAAVKIRWENPEKAAQKYKITAAQIAEADKLAEEYKKFSPASNSFKRRWPSRTDWRQRGNKHYDQGDEDHLGILAYHHALRDDPDQPDVMVDLATLYLRIHQKGMAIELLEEVEMRYPDHLTGLYNLGRSYKEVKLNEECRRVWGRLLRKADPVKDAEMVAAVKEGLRELE